MPELAEAPLNREPDKEALVQSFITYDDGYDRNHGLFPELNADTHRVRVDGDVQSPLKLSIAQLKNDYKQHSVVCALQCAGNRRHTMRTELKDVSGIDWGDAAAMNCKWTGPLLKDILERAGISLSAKEQENAHVAFASQQQCQEDTWYGASVPLHRCLDADKEIIVALERNNEALSVKSGYPVRIITPGIAGARSVKWLDQITVQNKESDNQYMQKDYKVLPPECKTMEQAKDYWHKVPPVQEMPVNSVIGVPKSGSIVDRNTDGTVNVQGYALPSGDEGPVTKVEVSGDGGTNWEDAELLHFEGEGKWSWQLWQAKVKVEPGSGRVIYSRATDAAGNTQPPKSEWNLRGVCYNGYGDAIDLTVKSNVKIQ